MKTSSLLSILFALTSLAAIADTVIPQQSVQVTIPIPAIQIPGTFVQPVSLAQLRQFHGNVPLNCNDNASTSDINVGCHRFCSQNNQFVAGLSVECAGGPNPSTNCICFR